MTRDLDIVPTAMAVTLSIFLLLFYFIALAVG